jgi:FixJ family two-component response regulator
VEVYKARVMEKMRVSRLAELIRLFARLEPTQ